MTRIVTALALALSLVTASAAAPAAAARPHATREVKKEDEKKFPMKADEFKQHVAARLAKARQHIEKRIEKKNLDEAKAKEIRAKFDAGAARVNAKVTEVTADGTVTLDEARQVREVMREALPHKKGDKRHKKDAKK